MPELPEVETVRLQLEPHLVGETVERAEVLDPRWCLPTTPEELEAALRGRTVTALGRRGKYLMVSFDDDQQLLMHLRMTGVLLWNAEQPAQYERARLHLVSGSSVTFCDPRRFGTAHLLPSAAARDAYLAERLGPEPLSDAFTPGTISDAARGREAPIKGIILNQANIAGVGNIYADEALFRATLHPARPGKQLTKGDAELLHTTIREALQAGIAAGGATIDDYRQIDGAWGSFQSEFLVHRREGLPCPICGTPITKMVVAGRGTYVCESCQRPPRKLPKSARRIKR